VFVHEAILLLEPISVISNKHSICALSANTITFLLFSISFIYGFPKELNKMNYITVLLNNFVLC